MDFPHRSAFTLLHDRLRKWDIISLLLPYTAKFHAGAEADAGERVAKRFSLKFKKPVALSWNVEGDEALHFWAEKELLAQLKADGLTASTKKLTI